MHTRGSHAPESNAAARDRYEALESTASVVLREATKAMDFDAAEYDRRVTPEVTETVQDALFAADLLVHVGTRAEFEDWLAERAYEVTEAGNPNVSGVAWHAAPLAEVAVAATFADAETAAVETVRRQAFGRIYRERLDA